VKQTANNGNGMGMPLTIASILLSRGETTNPRSDDGNAPSAG
jgi:hypothetical protein